MRNLFVIACLLICSSIYAQSSNPTSKGDTYVLNVAPIDTTVYAVAEKMPSFFAGTDSLYRYMYGNLIYPPMAKEMGIQGQVIVRFTVNTDGTITNAIVVKRADPLLDEEALRFILSMPNWIPGEQAGRKVRTIVNFPINFRLKY